MGLLAAIRGQQIYLDSNIWIYALEGYAAFAQDLTELFTAFDRGDLKAFTSELTLAEVLVKPIADGNAEIQSTYKQVLCSSPALQVVSISRDILIQAAELRVTSKLKLPDAIHAATALSTQCSTFLTNDQRFQSVQNLSVLVLRTINFS